MLQSDRRLCSVVSQDSRKSMPARREELQRENSELNTFILQKQTEKEVCFLGASAEVLLIFLDALRELKCKS